MPGLIQPDSWVCIRLPNELVRVIQITPNTLISLGKYGIFPANLLIERPFHLTYEIQDRREGENFSRLRVVPAAEIYAGIEYATTDPSSDADEADGDGDADGANEDGTEFSLVDKESGNVIARTTASRLGAEDAQTLSREEIEELKRDGRDAGKEIIAKLMLSHTALDRKTAFAADKYKIMKTKKYIRRFTVLPLDVTALLRFYVESREDHRAMGMREETLALLGCWANVHFAESIPQRIGADDQGGGDEQDVPSGGRWLVVDDTGGLVVASLADRMGILHAKETDVTDPKATAHAEQDGQEGPDDEDPDGDEVMADAQPVKEENSLDDTKAHMDQCIDEHSDKEKVEESVEMVNSSDRTTAKLDQDVDDHAIKQQVEEILGNATNGSTQKPSSRRREDEHGYALTNTITLIHPNIQPSLHVLNYYGFDATNPHPRPPHHPLFSHLLPLSWLQALEPDLDPVYTSQLEYASPEELAEWKSGKKSKYIRKHKRRSRVRHVIDSTRAGGFSGLVVATTMDLVSVLRHTLPLLAGGSPIAIYAPSLEPLTELADCFSLLRRTQWSSNPPSEAVGRTPEELEKWSGSEEFPLNPLLLLGVTIQTTRARRWQVLPGRTHPLMMGRGGADGYVMTAWRELPAAGKVAARGKYSKGKKTDGL